MEIENHQLTTTIVGLTGSGITTLTNTLIGRKVFEESTEAYSLTQETKGELGSFNEQQLFVIDTPGLQSSTGNDSQHLQQMTEYLKEMEEIHSFIIVMNFMNVRFDSNVKRLFEIISQLYPGTKWYRHIAIVWSNYVDELPENIKEMKNVKREELLEMIKEHIIPEITDEELQAIPQLFIDSIDARNKETESYNQLKELVEWMKQLEPLNKTCGEIQKVDKDVMKEEIQTEKRIVSDVTELNVRTIETALFERTKKTLYSGEILYSDWKEKEGTREKDKKVLIEEHQPQRITQQRQTVKILGERKIIDNVSNGRKKGRIMQRKRRIVEETTKNITNNSEIDQSPWEIIEDIEEEVEIGKFDEMEEENVDMNDNEKKKLSGTDILKFFSKLFKGFGMGFKMGMKMAFEEESEENSKESDVEIKNDENSMNN